MSVKQIWHALYGVGIAIALGFVLCGTALAEYTHGFFKYDVADGSVTITGYVGQDEVVTVPDAIAGKPVNTIGKGAFANSPAVKTVRIYSSVTKVQEGALAPGQTIEHITHGDVVQNTGDAVDVQDEGQDGSDGQTAGDDQGEDPKEAAQQSAGDAANATTAPSNPVGIRLKDGSLVTVDNEGNLLLVDTNWNESVLDDTHAYTRETTAQGDMVIRDSAGKAVEVDQEAATVSYADNEGNQNTYNAIQGVRETTDKDGKVHIIQETEEEFADNATGKNSVKERPVGSATDEQAMQTQEYALPVAAALAVAAGTAVFFVWQKAKSKKQKNQS